MSANVASRAKFMNPFKTMFDRLRKKKKPASADIKHDDGSSGYYQTDCNEMTVIPIMLSSDPPVTHHSDPPITHHDHGHSFTPEAPDCSPSDSGSCDTSCDCGSGGGD